MRGTSMSINNLKKVYAFTSISECEDNPQLQLLDIHGATGSYHAIPQFQP